MVSTTTLGQTQYYAGVDLHKKTSVITLKDSNGKFKQTVTFQNRDETDKMISYLKQYDKCQIAVEATFGWYWFCDTLQKAGMDITLVNPNRMDLIAKSYKKTDKHDSEVLCNALKADIAPTCYVPTQQEREMREIVRLRLRLVRRKTAIKNSIHSVLLKWNKHCPYEDLFGKSAQLWLEKTLEELAEIYADEIRIELTQYSSVLESIAKVETRLLEWKDPRIELLKTIPGVGDITSRMILSQVGDIKRFKDKNAFSAYAGLVPSTRSSGEHTYQGPIIKRSEKIIRLALSESIYHTIKKDAYINALYERIKLRKNSNKAKVAAMHALAEIIYDMLMKNRKFKKQPLASSKEVV